MIVVRQTPVTSGTPAYNPIEYVVDSTNKTQSNFQYIADVYITGDTTLPVYKRLKLSPHPTLGSAVFDINGVVKTYVSFDFANEGTSNVAGSYSCPNQAIQWTVKWGEEYGSSTSGVTAYPNMTQTSGLAWNSVYDFPDFATYSSANTFNNFNPHNNIASKFLTNQPRYTQAGGIVTYSRTINNGQLDYLYFCNYNNKATQYIVQTYDINLNIIQNALVDLKPTYNDFKDSFIKVDSGYNVNYINQANITGATQPLLTSSTKYFGVAMLDSGATPVSEYIVYKYEPSPCTLYTIYTLYFMNKLGGFDSFNFNGASVSSTKVDRSFYKRSQGTQTATTWTYSASEHSKAPYNTKASEEIKVTSDWITESESTWLLELITSPVVFMITGNDPTTLEAINIKESSYTKKKVNQDQIFNLELTLELSYDTYRQSW